jgi:hypothetical protein
MIPEKDRKRLLKLARDSISSVFSGKKLNSSSLKDDFSFKSGAFVTLTLNGELRGCIGYIEAVYPLYDVIVDASKSAAFRDPRFLPLSEKEFSDVKIEISVLTKPVPLNVRISEEYLSKIEVGKHGLVVRGSYGSGLLLPQVATEYKWNSREFLEHTCRKAGLDKNAWKDLQNKFYTFECELFSE